MELQSSSSPQEERRHSAMKKRSKCVSVNSQDESQVQKEKKLKWSPEEDGKIVQLRQDGLKWEDVSKQLPSRSPVSCRLRYQNYLEKNPIWDDSKMNKLARVYERYVEKRRTKS